MSLATLLRQSMQVLSPSNVRQYGGASDFQWNDDGPAYACDLQPIETTKKLTLLAMGMDSTHMVRWNPADVTVGEEDRIKIESRTFKVVSLDIPIGQRPGWPAKAFVQEVRI